MEQALLWGERQLVGEQDAEIHEGLHLLQCYTRQKILTLDLVKDICLHLATFSWKPSSNLQVSNSWSLDCNRSVSKGVLSGMKILMSSAYISKSTPSRTFPTELIKRLKARGPMYDPCTSPEVTSNRSDAHESTLTNIVPVSGTIGTIAADRIPAPSTGSQLEPCQMPSRSQYTQRRLGMSPPYDLQL